jgi:hypothetical protein
MAVGRGLDEQAAQQMSECTMDESAFLFITDAEVLEYFVGSLVDLLSA